MTERIKYQPTKNQLRKWNEHKFEMHSDEWFKNPENRTRKTKNFPWGLFKRDWLLINAKFSYEYQIGIWQGRVDAAQGLEYSEERNDKTYNIGYFRGYKNYESDFRGWDRNTQQRFLENYTKES